MRGGAVGLVAWCLCALALLLATPALAGDGSQRWFTVESEHFVIHYHTPLEDVAQRVAAVAERSHTTLAPVFDKELVEKTHIVLLDTTDGANGFASVIPRNRITLFVTAPDELSVLNDHDDWLYGLTAHEYTHILHLDSIGGLPLLYNQLFGKTWAPNQVQPRWVIEGIATHEESKRSSSGRVRSAVFDMYLRAAVLGGAELEIDAVSNAPRAWPHGTAAYLYGSHFIRYVLSRYGEDKLKELSWTYGSNPIPFGLNLTIEKITGRGFVDLYEEWRSYLRSKYRAQLEGIERRGRREGRRLTFTGETNTHPMYSRDGTRIIWRQSSGVERARYKWMPRGANAAKEHRYATLNGGGSFDVLPDDSIVFDQVWRHRTNYSFRDLYLYNKVSGRKTRLTYGQRAREPSVSPDGRRVAFVANNASRSRLAITTLTKDGSVNYVWQGEGRFDQASAPVWSPDGASIAFSAWTQGGYRDIWIYDVERATAARIQKDRALDLSPVYSPDGRYLYFSSDRSGVYNVYAHELATGTLHQVTNVSGGALLPAVSSDGKRMVYQGFNAAGYDLYELDLERDRWLKPLPYINDRPHPVSIAQPVVVSKSKPYRPLATLAPRAYTVTLQSDTRGGAVLFGINGADMVGQHAYSLSATVRLDDGNINLSGGYFYNRLWPSMRLAFARNAVRRGGFVIDGRNTAFTEEFLGATLGVSLPVKRDVASSLTVALDYDIDWLRNVGDSFDGPDPNDLLPRFPETDTVVAGLGLRMSYGDSVGYIYAVGPQEGKNITLSARINHPALGSDFESFDLGYAIQGYRQLPWGEASTLVARLSGGIRESNRQRTGAFSLGGVPDQDLINSVLNNLRAGSIGYLRGFESRSVSGTQFHLLNLEHRTLFFDVERGVQTLPLYLRRIHGALLMDAGDAFSDGIGEMDLNVSVGGSLRADFLLGYGLPTSIDIGYARGLTSDGINEFWMLVTGTI